MAGVLAYPEWSAYEFTSGEGLVMFDPQVELERAQADREAAGAAVDGADTDEASGGTG